MNDAALGVLIEYVHTGHIESDLDVVARTGGGARGYARDEVGLAYGEVELYLSAHKLGNINISVNNAVREGGELHGSIMDALGTQTDDNFLADVILKIGVVSLFGGQLEGLVLEVEVNVIALLNELAVDEVHLR